MLALLLPGSAGATADRLDQVVGALQSKGFAWLKISGPETYTFHRLKRCANEPEGSCFDQAGKLLRDKTLVEHYVGKPDPLLPQAVCRAADEVSQCSAVDQSCMSRDQLSMAVLVQVCKLMDGHTRRILEAISSSCHIGLPASGLNSILDDVGSESGKSTSSCLQLAQYFDPDDDWTDEPHTDWGVLTLIWSDNTSGLQVHLCNTSFITPGLPLCTEALIMTTCGADCSFRVY